MIGAFPQNINHNTGKQAKFYEPNVHLKINSFARTNYSNNFAPFLVFQLKKINVLKTRARTLGRKRDVFTPPDDIPPFSAPLDLSCYLQLIGNLLLRDTALTMRGKFALFRAWAV